MATFASTLRDVDHDDLDAVLAGGVRSVRDCVDGLAARHDRDLVHDISVARDAADVDLIAVTAIAVEMTRRRLGVTLHDGQVAASLALACGWSVQMRTGEGKTFAAIAPALYHAASGRAVHVVTANAYLARRDEGWSGQVLRALGITTGVLVPAADRATTRAAYVADVAYGAGAEFGFDFLRDNLWLPSDAPVQRGLEVAIVDEADAVLVDHAKTPLVLSAPARLVADPILRAGEVCGALVIDRDVTLDEVHQRVHLTPEGVARCEELLGLDNLYAPGPIDWPHLVENALRARSLLRRGRDYIVARGSVHVVDELTGRIAAGRRWSDGLHQAVEAKERVPMTAERRPVGRVTVGGYFGQYDRVVGMSGTLEGVEEEIEEVYGTRTVVIPTAKPVVRVDHDDIAFDDHATRVDHVVDDVVARHAVGQPVLVGTTSIEHTADLAAELAGRDIAHATLTAENDDEEAEVIAGAGRRGAVTVATQMAGRGVDIVLGGADASPEQQDEVRALGGLMVWGVAHHPAHRLDMQLRGRSGRQGDPGETCFAWAADDDVPRLAPPPTPPDELGSAGQRVAEDLDRELRDEVRELEGLVDRLQAHLYRWRRAAAEDDLTAELDAAIDQAAASVEERRLVLPGVTRDGLPRFQRRRMRELRERVAHAVGARREAVGPALFDDAARLLLRNLLVVVWTDQLDELDQGKQLSRLAFVSRVAAFTERIVRSYAGFEAHVRAEWVRQLLSFAVVEEDTPPVPDDARLDDDPPLPDAAPVERDGGTDAEDEFVLADWHGWSFNRYVRQRFGMKVPEPPLVLAIDAVGDAAGPLRLELDLDDPTRTRVRVAPARR